MNDWKKQGDQDLKIISDGIQPLLNLKKVEINMKNWAFKNAKLTNIGIKDFFKSFQQNNLEYLGLNLEK